MEMVQVKLQSFDKIQTVWIEKRNNIKKGCRVTLKDGKKKILWEVIELYNVLDSHLINNDWVVGGLSGRRLRN